MELKAGVALACASREWQTLTMHYVYVIRSLIKNWIYIGMSHDVNNRINQHNKGLVRSSKHFKPFELIFVQIVNDTKEARDLEKYLKVRFNKECLLQIINN